jgi:hypothetical protein
MQKAPDFQQIRGKFLYVIDTSTINFAIARVRPSVHLEQPFLSNAKHER